MGVTGRDRGRRCEGVDRLLRQRSAHADSGRRGHGVWTAGGSSPCFVMAAMDHRDYPFDLVGPRPGPRRVANRQPLINVVYEYHRFEEMQVREPGDGDGVSALPPGRSGIRQRSAGGYSYPYGQTRSAAVLHRDGGMPPNSCWIRYAISWTRLPRSAGSATWSNSPRWPSQPTQGDPVS